MRNNSLKLQFIRKKNRILHVQCKKLNVDSGVRANLASESRIL